MKTIAILVFCFALAVPVLAHETGTRDVGAARTSGPVLLVRGGDTQDADAFYAAAMEAYFGTDGWDLYDVPGDGFPQPIELWLSTLRQHRAVIWHGRNTSTLATAADVLNEYVNPSVPGQTPGKLLLAIPGVDFGTLPNVFKARVLRVGNVSAPVDHMHIPAGATALAYDPYLPHLEAPANFGFATGFDPLEGTQTIYQMEYCVGCYSLRPPYDPIVGVRWPARDDAFYARTITLGLPLHGYVEGNEVLDLLMLQEWGILPPASQTGGQGLIHMSISNRGYVGNAFSNPGAPSLRYPYPLPVEHLFVGGLWVGARTDDGSYRVSTATVNTANYVSLDALCEFFPNGEPMHVSSSDPASPYYDPAAIAPYQVDCDFNDGGVNESDHVPLGVAVHLRALSWNDYPFDDAVVLDLRIANISGESLSDVYVGWYDDTTVGNTLINDPYWYNPPFWNYFDDVNGAWRPGDWANDPDLWLMWEHDDDGDGGYATSWVGCRLLGTDPAPQPPAGTPPVSYHQRQFPQFPDFDDTYVDGDGITQPGRYQIMGDGAFDVGEGFDFAYDWGGLLSTGPFPVLADGDTLAVTFAMVCGPDARGLWANSLRIAQLFASQWTYDPLAAPETAAAGVRLLKAVPNPCNPSTEIRFGLAQATRVDLAIYGVDGRRVRTLAQSELPAGEHRVTWNGRDDAGQAVASGIYLVRLAAAGAAIQTQRVVVVR